MKKEKILKTSTTKQTSTNNESNIKVLNNHENPARSFKTNDVRFRDLRKRWNFTDYNSVVLLATTFEEDQSYQEVDDFLSNELGFSKGKNLIGMHKILDNVLGEKGRSDYLLEFDNPQTRFCFPKRLLFPDLIWVTDFIENFHSDYRYNSNKDFPGLYLKHKDERGLQHIIPIDGFYIPKS